MELEIVSDHALSVKPILYGINDEKKVLDVKISVIEEEGVDLVKVLNEMLLSGEFLPYQTLQKIVDSFLNEQSVMYTTNIKP
ncbi:hypothetical protein MHBO_000789 [Bonamia ostreae]|uniref:Uncharacterized protein n=1 Tax=Bonamia ostreae TaxID=126728 RepID=A0ABV2AHD5_9EUKA